MRALSVLSLLISFCCGACTREDATSVIATEGLAGIAAKLGDGYSSLLTHVIKGEATPCIVPLHEQLSLHPAPKAILKTAYSKDLESLEHIKNFGVEAGIGLIKAKVDLIDALAQSQLSLSFQTDFTYELGTALIPQPTLSNRAAALKTDLEREKACGDEFIDQIDLGARFSAALIFNFKQKHDLLKFNLKVILDLFLGHITLASVSAQHALHDVATSLDIKVFQQGGDQDEFKKIRQDVEVSECLTIKVSQQASPKFEDEIKNCLSRYNKALAYARNDFIKQIKFAKTKKLTSSGLQGLAILEARSRRYDEAGLWWFQPQTPVDQRFLSIRGLMLDLQRSISAYQGALYSLTAIDSNLKSATPAFTLDGNKKASLDASLLCLKRTLDRLLPLRDLCDGSGDESKDPCLQGLQQVRLTKIPYFSEHLVKDTSWPLDECITN